MPRKLVVPLAVVAVAASLLATDPGAPAAASPGTQQQVVDAQLLIHDINLARRDPGAYRAATGIAIPTSLGPMPPLAVNPSLMASAQTTADLMAGGKCSGHVCDGKWPNRRARDAGFPLPAHWEDDKNYIESQYGGSTPTHGLLGSASHAPHLMGGTDFFALHRQIGAGRNGTSWAIHTAYANTGDLFVTGVVYADSNDNGRMDRGEGIGGVKVTVGSTTITTNAGGGYAVKLTPGTYTVTASGGGYQGSVQGTVTVTDANVLVDFVSGKGPVGTIEKPYPFIDSFTSPFAAAITWMGDTGVTRGCNPPRNTRYCPDRLVSRAEMATFLTRAFGLSASNDNGPFIDHLTNIHRTAINAIRIAGVTIGCNPPQNTRFCPGGNVTRAEIATFIARYANLPNPSTNYYTDISSHWGRDPINAMAAVGIAWACNPPANDRFCPNSAITRAEMAQWLHRSWQRGYLPDA